MANILHGIIHTVKYLLQNIVNNYAYFYFE